MSEEKKDIEEKDKGGRPKEPFKPWDNWEEDIISLYSEGASDVEVRGLIIKKTEDRETLCHELWERWLNEEIAFSETIKKGREFCQIWWERNGRVNLKESSFNATLWYMNMKNRFKWADRHDINADVNQTTTDMTEEAMDNKIAELTEKLKDSK